ncbi:EF-hand calcium-binding domain-containing protein 6-like [Dendropsophus ebraccatus]|uniref:EF-hand calcium-binding domain-containing protein 6-like n=1 Tax=Dendropsophus ebraccatus TaxID=150705 RepID=UPI003831B7E8
MVSSVTLLLTLKVPKLLFLLSVSGRAHSSGLFMATRGLSGAQSKLPGIQHPVLRRGDPESLSVRGFSRSEGRGETTLQTQLRTYRTEQMDDWTKLDHWANIDRKHWERNGKEEKKGSATDTRSQQETQCDELNFRLLEKINSGGFYDLKRLFWSHDPEARGRVSRDALLIILTTFLGRFIHKTVYQQLLRRLHLEGKSIITFDAFYDHFKLEEDNSPPDWLDPMKRKHKGALKTAYEVHLQLKDMANNRYFELLKLFPNDRLNASDLRSVLTKIGIKMSEEEYKKLWKRYVKDEADVLRFDDLQCHLGTKKMEESRSLLLSALQKVSDSQEPQQIKTTNKIVTKTGNERKLSLSIEKWLKEKFREGARAMKTEFSEYDPQSSGTVSKENFLKVLEKFHLPLTGDQLGHFLSRCGLDETLPHVNYLEFLQRLQSRNQNGRAYKVLSKPDYGTGKRESCSLSTTSAAEDKLIRFLHTDFNSLLSEFRKADKNNLKVLSPQDFRAILEKRFSIKVTDEEFAHVVETLPVDHYGDIRYLEFMATFDSRDGNLSIWDGRETVLTSCSRKPKVANKSGGNKKSHLGERSLEQLTDIIKHLVKNNYETLERNFNEIDDRNTRRMTAETLYQLLKRCDVSPEMSREDVGRIWKTLILNQDQTVDFYQFVRHFGFSIKSSCFPNAKISPPVRGDVDCLIRSLKLNSDTKIIANFLQTKVKLLLDDLWLQFRELDPQGSGCVTREEFLDLLQELSPDLTKHQCDTIAAKFTDGHNRISYVKFLQPYQTGSNMIKQGGGKAMKTQEKMASPTQSLVCGLDAITNRLRQKISSTEWRNLLQSCMKMDKDGSGLLSLPEFRSVVKLCNIVLDEDDIYHIMSHYDKDLAGKIDYSRLLSDPGKSK